MKIAVIALGGNALTRKGDKGTYQELKNNIGKSMKFLIPILKKYKTVIVSGSGPQIGSIILKNEIAKNKVPQMPLHVLDAQLEGELGYLIEQSLMNELNKHKLQIPVVTTLNQVLVDKKDKAFTYPTKPVGPYYMLKEAIKLRKKGYDMKNDAGKGFRRIVASPKPIKIIEADIIKTLLKSGTIVISTGGGGIPVYLEKSSLKGVDAVIDKDRASSCLAKSINANLLFILTDISKVYLNYKKKNQVELKKVKLKDIKWYLEEGHFLEGSMKPKIEAAIEFLENSGEKVIITSPESLSKALNGKDGTIITR